MINLYYDLSVANGGAGTGVSPYGMAEFETDSAAGTWGDADETTVYLKGSASSEVSPFLMVKSENNDVHVKAWDLVEHGPWRLNVSGVGVVPGINEFSGGILFTSGVLQVQAITEFSNIVIKCQIIEGGAALKGCIVSTAEYISLSGSTLVDSILSADSVGIELGEVTANNCAFSLAPIETDTTLVGCVTDYGDLVLPAWDAPRASWSYEEILPGLPTPPQPGNSPYAGYETDLWGNARIGIGTGSMVDEVIPASVTVPPQGKSLVGMPGANSNARSDINKNTNRGNPQGNVVDNSAGEDIASGSKTQKQGKRGTLAGQKLPHGKLFTNT